MASRSAGGLALPLLFVLGELTLCAAPASAAPAPQGGGHQATVRFVNEAPVRRREWGLATVPFPPGAWPAGKRFGADGVPSELVPFGARWPDGSVRFAQLAAYLQLSPGEERLVTVRERRPITQPFVLSPWTSRGGALFGFQLAAGLPGGAERTVGLVLHAILENTPVRKVAHFRARIPDTWIVYDLWVTFFSNQDHAPFELRITSSSTAAKAWFEDLEYLELRTTGAMPVVRAFNRLGVDHLALSPVGPTILRLLPKVRLYDGQGAEWWGDLVFFHPDGSLPDRQLRAETLVAAIEHPLLGCATNWRSSKAYGPFGYVPKDPPWIKDGGRAWTRQEYLAFRAWARGRGKVFDEMPLGMRRQPAFTGDQHDFGVAKLVDIVSSGLPQLIERARINTIEEAYRPVHHREADGSPVRAAAHPRWVTWSGRTHFNRIVSPDRLGKPYPDPFLNANGWSGRDNEHWSSLTMAATYLLTRSYALRYELDNEAELYLAGHTLPSAKPNWSTNAIGQPRAVGRTLLSMAWNWVVTGREDLRRRMRERVMQCVARQHVGLHVPGAVKPLMTAPPDPRNLPTRTHWKPWEEALAIPGLEACYRVTGEPTARLLAMVGAKNLLTWGWRFTPSGLIGFGVGWKKGGAPLSPQEYKDPEWATWPQTTGFNTWALASTILAHKYSFLLQDPDLEARANFAWLTVEKNRRPPRDGGWDRYSEWEALR